MSDPSAPLVVIKIKRKATDAPLTSLVIEGSERATKRIRSGTTTPNSAGSSVKSQASGSGVFRLAETVGEGWVGYGAEGQALRDRIQHLLTQPTQTPPAATSSSSSSAPQPPATPQNVLQPKRFQIVKSATASRSGASGAIGKRTGSGKGKGRMEMPIVGNLRRLGGASARAMRNEPPEVITASKPKPSYPNFRFIDAQAVPSSASAVRSKSLLNRSTTSVPDVAVEPEVDQMTPAFARSVQVNTGPIGDSLPEVVTAVKPSQDVKPAEFVPAAYNYRNITHVATSSAAGPSSSQEAGGEFVYDLYYRDANAGDAKGMGLGIGDGVAVGALAGFDELMDDEDASASEEYDDEVDEDSNDEDFYRNDYPEDEDADSEDGGIGEPDRETWMQPHSRPGVGNGYDSDRDGFEVDGNDEEEYGEHWQKKSQRNRKKLFGLEDSDEDDEDAEMERRARLMAENDDGGEVIGDVEDWKVLTDDD